MGARRDSLHVQAQKSEAHSPQVQPDEARRLTREAPVVPEQFRGMAPVTPPLDGLQSTVGSLPAGIQQQPVQHNGYPSQQHIGYPAQVPQEQGHRVEHQQVSHQFSGPTAMTPPHRMPEEHVHWPASGTPPADIGIGSSGALQPQHHATHPEQTGQLFAPISETSALSAGFDPHTPSEFQLFTTPPEHPFEDTAPGSPRLWLQNYTQAMPVANTWKRVSSRRLPGTYYYWNEATGEVSMVPPWPWTVRESRSRMGIVYFFNELTGETAAASPEV